MIGLILRIKGIENVNCSLDFYVERDRALHFEKGDLVFVYDNGPEYYVCIDTDKVGRGALKCRAVIVDGERKVAVSGYTGFTIPCMGEGATISCGGYSIEFSEAESLPQGGDVPDVDWPDGSNLNDYITDGVYSIRGNRVEGDNIPILNDGPIAARLTVISTDDNGGNKVVTQVLTLNNNAGGEGNVYVRSSQEGHWKPWGKLQTNVEVGQVTTLDNLVDNGIYSGVLTDGSPTTVGSFYDTFVLIVLNNYSVAGPLGVPQSICQLKYSLKLDATIEVAKRKRDEFGNWTEWESVGGGSAAIEAQAPLAQKDGKLTLNIGDGLRVENEKLVAVPQTSGGNALRALFVAAGAEYNDSGSAIEKDTPWGEKILHLPGCYHFNHIGDLTDEDMAYIIANQSIVYHLNIPRLRQKDNKLRTFIPLFNNQGVGSLASIAHSTFSLCYNLEVVKFTARVELENIDPERYRTGGSYMFFNCNKLKYIQPLQLTATTTILGMFEGCKSLIEVEIYNLAGSISFSDSNLINKKTILCAIQNAAPTSAITITLHPNTYARLVDDVDIIAALRAKPLVTLVSA